MTAKEQIKALEAQTRYQLQVVSADGNPSAVDTKATPAEGRAALQQYVTDRLAEGYELAEADGHLVLQRRTTRQVEIEDVEQLTPHLLVRSAWDVLSVEDQDALLVADAKESGRGDEFPIEWLPAKDQEAERVRRAKLHQPPVVAGAVAV